MRLYTTGRGYEELRPPGREGASQGIKHHRLLAYAWGKIDSLSDGQHVDHRLPCRWLNIEGNLRPLGPEEHARMHRFSRMYGGSRDLDPDVYDAESTEVFAHA